MLLTCRVIGVSDLCDFPPEAAAKPKVSRSCFNSAEMTSAEVTTFCSPMCISVFVPFCICQKRNLKVDLNCQNEGHQSIQSAKAFLLTSSTCVHAWKHAVDNNS